MRSTNKLGFWPGRHRVFGLRRRVSGGEMGGVERRRKAAPCSLFRLSASALVGCTQWGCLGTQARLRDRCGLDQTVLHRFRAAGRRQSAAGSRRRR